MSILIHRDPLPLKPGPQPETDFKVAYDVANSNLSLKPQGLPPLLPENEWVGRENLLQLLTQDLITPQCHIVGLIGFGGEGKTSLARYWIECLNRGECRDEENKSVLKPDGLFWWSFYEKPSVDEFFEATLKYLSDGEVDITNLYSAHAKANFLAGMLPAGRYIFVLDGMEVLQHQDGDEYGLILSNDLLKFLNYFAAGAHKSFCLITSRVPLYDLIAYITYTHRDVNRLSEMEGKKLLKNLGVLGSDMQINRVVNQWEGHALTLSLLSSYLVNQCKKDITLIPSDLAPTEKEEQYDLVRRLLRRYDEHLTEDEREFLEVLSSFRQPVQKEALTYIFQWLDSLDCPTFFSSKTENLLSQSSVIDNEVLEVKIEIVNRLVKYRILRYDPDQKTYTFHPLIRQHYQSRLDNKQKEEKFKKIQCQIARFYLSIFKETSNLPTFQELTPLIEAVHHLCCAKNYDEAYNIWWEKISQFRRYVLDRQLGESDAALDLVTEFFPKGDISKNPLVTNFNAQLNILHSVGHLLKNLGHTREAESFYLREISGYKKLIKWEEAGFSYNHLIGLYILIGSLTKGMKVFKDCPFVIRKIEEKYNNNPSKSLGYSLDRLRLVLLAKKGWISFLLGKTSLALEKFQEAIRIQRKISNQQSHQSKSKKKGKRKHEHQNHQKINFLYGSSGIYYVMVLHRLGRYKEALELHLKNLSFCHEKGWLSEYSWCQWVLGDLLADDQANEKEAQQLYSSAIKIAKNISNQPTLISALLARGRWMAKHLGDAAAAKSDLKEALGYALSGGYRLFEIDIRVALASAHLVEDNIAEAQEQANQALKISEEIKYYWGKKYAKEVLESIKVDSNKNETNTRYNNRDENKWRK